MSTFYERVLGGLSADGGVPDTDQSGLTWWRWVTPMNGCPVPGHDEMKNRFFEWTDNPEVGFPGEMAGCQCFPAVDVKLDLLKKSPVPTPKPGIIARIARMFRTR